MTTAGVLNGGVLDLALRIGAATGVNALGETLLAGLRPMGALSLIAESISHLAKDYKGPELELAPPGWKGSDCEAFAARHNPNPSTLRRLRAPFRWREAKLPNRALDGTFWDAVGAFGGVDGLVVPLYDRRRLYAVSMSFATTDWSPRDRLAMEFAGHVFLDRLRALLPDPPPPPHLTPRERDCMAFVAEGKSDWEISVILGVSQHTAHHHVENARRKLGAATRAQAVAQFVLSDLV